jgi:putative salt-induced outer membrane protein YdiY
MRSYKTALVIMTVLAGALLAQATTSRAQVVAQGQATNAPASDVVKDWHGHLGAGATVTKGNSDSVLLNLGAADEKDWKFDECSFGGEYNYGLNNWGKAHEATGQNESKSASNVSGFGDYKHLFTDRLYASLHLSAIHDDVAGVRYRGVITPSVGYYIIKSDVTRFNAEIGPGYLRERLGVPFTTPPTHEPDTGYVTLRIAERCEHDLSKTAKIWESVEYLPNVEKFSEYLLNSEAGVSAAINAHLALRLVAQDRYNSKPPLLRQSNDFQLVASIAWNFGPE